MPVHSNDTNINNSNQSNAQGTSSTSSNNDNDTDDGFVLGSRLNSLPSLCPDPRQAASKKMASSSNSNNNNTTTSNASNSHNTLFGRVMQQSSSLSSSSQLHTPTKQRHPPPTSSFLSPGGFKLRNAIDAAVATSPFGFTKRLDEDDTSRDSSVAPLPAWRRADSIEQLPMDWSLKEKLTITSSVLEPSSWRWVQRTTVNNNTTQDAWQEARTYWQYPPPGMEKQTTIRPQKSSQSLIMPTEYSALGGITHIHSAGNSKTAASRHAVLTPSERALQQLQIPTSLSVPKPQQAWQTTFTSLYQSWHLHGLDYFYGRAVDHTILFYYKDKTEPCILLSSCDKAFREWCKLHGVTLYVEPSKPFVVEQWQVATAPTPLSPGSAAELAALRRAHVLKKTVGADVSISFRQSNATNITQQRRALQQVPALQVVGEEDCAAVAEYYGNTAGRGAVLPILLAPRPFCGATLQMSSVRWVGTGRLEIEGLLLPSQLPRMLQQILKHVQAKVDEQQEADDGDDVTVRLEVTCVAAKPPGLAVVRPLEDVAVGQPSLWAMHKQNANESTNVVGIVADTISQVVWDSDEPDVLSYKVTPGVG